MYKRIMAAIDDDYEISKVLRTTVEIAKHFGATVAICHALDERILSRREPEVMLPSSLGQTDANLRAGAKAFLDKAAEFVRAAGVDVEIRIVESEKDQVPEMLANAATEWKADLLVVGTHSRGGVERFFDSIAKNLAGKIPTSLLIVRGD